MNCKILQAMVPVTQGPGFEASIEILRLITLMVASGPRPSVSRKYGKVVNFHNLGIFTLLG